MGFKKSDFKTYDRTFKTPVRTPETMIVVFKRRLEVQTQVCNSETYVCRLIVHLACHSLPLNRLLL